MRIEQKRSLVYVSPARAEVRSEVPGGDPATILRSLHPLARDLVNHSNALLFISKNFRLQAWSELMAQAKIKTPLKVEENHLPSSMCTKTRPPPSSILPTPKYAPKPQTLRSSNPSIHTPCQHRVSLRSIDPTVSDGTRHSSLIRSSHHLDDAPQGVSIFVRDQRHGIAWRGGRSARTTVARHFGAKK